MHKYVESKTTQIMVAAVLHVTSWAGHTKYQAAWFLLNRVYKEPNVSVTLQHVTYVVFLLFNILVISHSHGTLRSETVPPAELTAIPILDVVTVLFKNSRQLSSTWFDWL